MIAVKEPSVLALNWDEWLAMSMSPKKSDSSRSLTPEHKAALAEGRKHGNAVRAYLDALDANKPKRGRKRTTESIQKRLGAIDAEIGSANRLRQLQLTQERYDLEAELGNVGETVDLSALEKDFIESAAPYAASKGISYAAFRAVGVSPEILKAAGVSRGRG